MRIKGISTGIGSLPHTDAQAAIDLVLKNCPEMPFWPQLPRRAQAEGMLAQFSENIPCIKLGKNGLAFNSRYRDKELEVFYDRIISQDLDYFKISPDYAAGLYGFLRRLDDPKNANILQKTDFLKFHVTGPFTFSSSINDGEGRALLHDDIFLQVILKALAMKALWQVKLFKKYNKKMVVFIDEPYLGCFGSAFTPINKEQVVKVLSELTETLKAEDVLIGVHCCGNTDWSIFTDIPGIDIINFDAHMFLDRFILYSDNLKSFFKRGGILCWGIVPTQEFSDNDTAKLLADRIKTGINAFMNKGVDKELISERLLISPACGLGVLESEKAERILRVLYEVSLLIKKSF